MAQFVTQFHALHEAGIEEQEIELGISGQHCCHVGNVHLGSHIGICSSTHILAVVHTECSLRSRHPSRTMRPEHKSVLVGRTMRTRPIEHLFQRCRRTGVHIVRECVVSLHLSDSTRFRLVRQHIDAWQVGIIDEKHKSIVVGHGIHRFKHFVCVALLALHVVSGIDGERILRCHIYEHRLCYAFVLRLVAIVIL